MIDPATRRSINEAEVRRYFNSWDPGWRWVLILGLRDMRANLDRLGQLARDEAADDSWIDEGAQHCEDLFALLSFLRDPVAFARRMGSYAAGKVVAFKDTLKVDTDAAIAKRFCLPLAEVLAAELSGASDPEAAIAATHDGYARLGALVRRVVDFYETYEFFHVQYKHGLKLPFRPFGGPPRGDTIAERKTNVVGPLFALSNEALSKLLKRPPSQQAIMFTDPGPDARAHLAELVENRDLLRIQMAGPPVDLNEVAELSRSVARLLRIAAANRVALGELDGDGRQIFQLPGVEIRETLNITIEPSAPIALKDLG